MSEIQQRPEPVAFDSELARRADAPRYRAERIASAVAYHAGPEIGFTAAVGGGGALLVHPAALPVVAVVVAVYAAVDRLTRRRDTGPSRARTTDTSTKTESASESAEGVA